MARPRCPASTEEEAGRTRRRRRGWGRSVRRAAGCGRGRVRATERRPGGRCAIRSRRVRPGPARWPGPWNRPILATPAGPGDRKSTRLNSSHVRISYAVFCLKKKKKKKYKYNIKKKKKIKKNKQ